MGDPGDHPGKRPVALDLHAGFDLAPCQFLAPDAVASFADHPAEGGQHVEDEGRVGTRQEAGEGRSIEDEELAPVDRRDARGARPVLDERDLAEEIAPFARRELNLVAIIVAPVHTDGSGQDDIHAVGLVALLEDDGSGVENNAPARGGELGQLIDVQPGKERNSPQLVEVAVGIERHLPTSMRLWEESKSGGRPIDLPPLITASLDYLSPQ